MHKTFDIPDELGACYGTMSHDEFTKLFKHIESFREEVRQEFNRIYEQFDRFYATFDNHEKRLETTEQERLASNAQLDRHELRLTNLEKQNLA